MNPGKSSAEKKMKTGKRAAAEKIAERCLAPDCANCVNGVSPCLSPRGRNGFSCCNCWNWNRGRRNACVNGGCHLPIERPRSPNEVCNHEFCPDDGRCNNYLCRNCKNNVSPCLNPVGGIDIPLAWCCNCWSDDIYRRCLNGCQDWSDEEDVSIPPVIEPTLSINQLHLEIQKIKKQVDDQNSEIKLNRSMMDGMSQYIGRITKKIEANLGKISEI